MLRGLFKMVFIQRSDSRTKKIAFREKFVNGMATTHKIEQQCFLEVDLFFHMKLKRAQTSNKPNSYMESVMFLFPEI